MPERDYHDYVFKGGKLVGEFEAMYRETDVVPWHQDKQAQEWFCDIALSMLSASAPYQKVVDIGCGLGYFTARVHPLCKSLIGIDISPTAVQRAKRFFPEIEFSVADIRSEDFSFGQFDLVIAKDLFWYVFPQMETVAKNITAMANRDGHLFIFKSFPSLSKEFVGKEKIPNPDALLGYFLGPFGLEHSCLVKRHLYENEGPMVMYFLRRISTNSKWR